MLEHLSGTDVIVLLIGGFSLILISIVAVNLLFEQDGAEITTIVDEIYARVDRLGGQNVDIAFEGDIYLKQGRKWRFLVNYDDAYSIRQTYYVSLYVNKRSQPVSDLRWFIQA